MPLVGRIPSRPGSADRLGVHVYGPFGIRRPCWEYPDRRLSAYGQRAGRSGDDAGREATAERDGDCDRDRRQVAARRIYFAYIPEEGRFIVDHIGLHL